MGVKSCRRAHSPPVYGFGSGGAADRLCCVVVLSCVFLAPYRVVAWLFPIDLAVVSVVVIA